MNYTIPSQTINPYTDTVRFCNIATDAIHSHYQGILNSYWVLFMVGGLLMGFIVGAIWITNYFDKKGRLLAKNK